MKHLRNIVQLISWWIAGADTARVLYMCGFSWIETMVFMCSIVNKSTSHYV